MSRKKVSITAIGMLFVLLTLSATACNGAANVSTPQAPATAEPLPTVAPTPEPTTAPTPEAQGKSPKNARPARMLQALLKGTGLEAGTVTANKGGALDLRTLKGSELVQTNASTIIVIPGQNGAQVSDIRRGDRVVVRFPNDDSTKPAAFLLDLPADFNADNVMLGAVQSNKRSGLTVRTRAGAENLTTSADTSVVNLTGDQPALGSLYDLKPGNAIIVIGKADGGTFSAQTIVVLDKDVRDLLGKIKKNQPVPVPTPTPGA